MGKVMGQIWNLKVPCNKECDNEEAAVRGKQQATDYLSDSSFSFGIVVQSCQNPNHNESPGLLRSYLVFTQPV